MSDRTIIMGWFWLMAMIAIFALSTLSFRLGSAFIMLASLAGLPVVTALSACVPPRWMSRPGIVGAGQAIAVSAMVSVATILIAGTAVEALGLIRIPWMSGTLVATIYIVVPPINLIWIIGGLLIWRVLRNQIT